MGNCLRHKSSMTQNGDDDDDDENWASLDSERLLTKAERTSETEDTTPLGEKKGVSSSTEVKIRITKKQLEELLGRIDIQGLSLEQVLSQLMNVSVGDQYHTQHRSWRPALQSIPEVN